VKNFSSKISLIKNFRGVYELDTSKGCSAGMDNNEKGCYNECYAYRYSKKWGYNFNKTVYRYFDNIKHKILIINQINKIDMPFIRFGVSGDPSENWEHTISICEQIFKYINKEIVIITKHWNNLTNKQLQKIKDMGVCVNTSISALDSNLQIKNRLKQYNRLKKVSKSILRIVTCSFNINSNKGIKYNKIQKKLLKNENVIETVFRVYKKNKYVEDAIINIEKIKFLGKSCCVSRNKKNTYFGNCKNCVDRCGIDKKHIKENKNNKFQLKLF